jgi:hypothetical protein
VKATRYFIVLLVEFSSGMELGHHQLESRNPLHGVNSYGNASAIVFYADNIVLLENYEDIGTVTCQGFVDRIINNLINEMMQTVDACRADVHAGPFSNGLEPFEYLNAIRRIG